MKKKATFIPHLGNVIIMTSSSRVFMFRRASRCFLASFAKGGNGGKQQPSKCTNSSKGMLMTMCLVSSEKYTYVCKINVIGFS